MKKIVIYGAECTGKSTLAEELAEHYQTIFCPEFSRYYLSNKNRLFSRTIISEYADIEQLALGQIAWEDYFMTSANGVLLCDTDLLTIKNYSVHYFGKSPDWIDAEIANRRYDFYLLMDTDLEWQADGLRDRPEQRKEMFDLFREALVAHHQPFALVSGSGEERKRQAIAALKNHLGN